MTRTATKELKSRLAQFNAKTVLVVGDIMLDTFVRGEVERISAEAPVPIVLETSRTAHMGGAGNTAANVVALGARTILLGVVGGDEEGRTVKQLARVAGIEPKFIVDAKRPTTVKMRIAARRHQLVRVDRESAELLSKTAARDLLTSIARLPVPDAVIVSDYAKGVVTEELMSALKRRFGAKRILADFRPSRAPLFKRVRAITPNIQEAYELCGIRATTNANAGEVVRTLAKRFMTSIILTRGEHGMTVYEEGNGRPVHVPSEAREVFDVTGAGDTVIAVAALMLACGAKLQEAAQAANYVAGVAVGREGTAVISAKELSLLLKSRAE
jgi:rfaE bifunctional protein kinase chain/domain